MKIDVIIPVYRPTKKLIQLIAAMQKQSYPVNKILLLHTQDGHDFSRLKTFCKSIPIIEIPIKKSEFDHGGTRNLGMETSDAEIVVLMTQDAIPKNGQLLERLVKALEQDENIAVAYARQEADPKDGVLEYYTRAFNYPERSMIKSKKDFETMGIKTYFCSNVCAAYRKAVYQQLDGFESPIIFNEDMVFAANAIRKNYKVAYVADAIVFHAHKYSKKQLVRRNFDLGVSQACYPDIFGKVKSETEGWKLIDWISRDLICRGQYFQVLELLIQSACKYVGYQLGKHYKILPESWVLVLTMNQEFWKRRKYGTEKQN